jgi:hypothetical protein
MTCSNCPAEIPYAYVYLAVCSHGLCETCFALPAKYNTSHVCSCGLDTSGPLAPLVRKREQERAREKEAA